jgi:hypothetical protein
VIWYFVFSISSRPNFNKQRRRGAGGGEHSSPARCVRALVIILNVCFKFFCFRVDDAVTQHSADADNGVWPHLRMLTSVDANIRE